MPATPNITLTATLLDYSGNTIGTSAQPAWLRIALCGFGGVLPAIAGVGNITKISSWFVDIPFTGTAVSVKLWGNDQISPSGTYYAISVLDTQKNVVQCGVFVFTGTTTIDLSNAAQVVPGVPVGLPTLSVQPCTGAVPGTAYTAPGTVVGVFYNGILLQPGQSLPTLSYTVSGGTTINLNFATETGDLIYALCIM
jgi:hypothetical protein